VPAYVNRDTARRVVPLFRPYRVQVAAVVGLIVVTSTIGTINPLLIQVVFNQALFVPGGPNLHLLVILVSIMAVVTSWPTSSYSCPPSSPWSSSAGS
jgi:ATP-binding cassette, subfamily B, bacterial